MEATSFQPVRTHVATDHLWAGAKRWGVATALALFPLGFLLDGLLGSFSPVLPGVITVALGIALFPLAIMEVAAWRNGRAAEAQRDRWAVRFARAGAFAFVVAILWVAAWLWRVA